MSVDPRYPHVIMHSEQEVRDRLADALAELHALGLTEDGLRRRASVDWTASADEYVLWDEIVSWRYLLGKSGWNQPARGTEDES